MFTWTFVHSVYKSHNQSNSKSFKSIDLHQHNVSIIYTSAIKFIRRRPPKYLNAFFKYFPNLYLLPIFLEIKKGSIYNFLQVFSFIFNFYLLFIASHFDHHFLTTNCPVGWSCRIHRLPLCRGVRSPPPSSVLKI